MLKVALLINEYFGACGTGFGGYGFLARRYIAKYIPNEEIKIEVLLGRGKHFFSAENNTVDGVNVYRLPKSSIFAKLWLRKQKYDVYLSIEMTTEWILKQIHDSSAKLVFWIQDPRPKSDWDEINTVELFPEPSYYDQRVYNTVNKWYNEGKIRFYSQGYFLNKKAKELYMLPDDTHITYLPNPVDIDMKLQEPPLKKNIIIFLGRIESVKRGWLFCEIAKRMPQYEFYMLGQTFTDKDKNKKIMAQYKKISNLHFEGHVDGKIKEEFLKKAKILVNTSIHEALPISFLEALAYGTLIVSNRDPEGLTTKFGEYVGEVLGDGFDKVDLYVNAIEKIMNDKDYLRKQKEAMIYIREIHNVSKFVKNLREILIDINNQ